jgi:hypothetical protein
MSGKFATAINCMDGRTQLPVNEWMRDQFQVDFVDTITEPGPDAILSNPTHERMDSIRKRVLISVNGHGSRVVALVGHHDCAGNPVPKEMHLHEVLKGCERLGLWGLPIRIIGLWVGEDWTVEKVFDTQK